MVVGVIGMLMSIAVPGFVRISQGTKVMRTAQDLRQFSGAIKAYTLERGAYPTDTGKSEIPAGMTEYMPHQWLASSPVGGDYEWDNSLWGTQAAISIAQVSPSADTLNVWFQLDKLLDNGNLVTGQLRLRPSAIMWVIEE